MVVLWSLNFIIAKIALREFPPILLSCVRTSLAALFIIPIYLWNARTKKDTWNRDDVPVLIFLGVFGVALNQIFFVAGMSRTSVGHSALMIGITPVIVLLIAAAMRQEHITLKKVLGMLLAMGGVAVLNFSPAKSAGATLFGDMLILMASITFALFTVIGKRVSKRHDSITVNTFAYLGGAIALLPLSYYSGHDFSFAALSTSAWLSVIYMAAFPSVLCYLIYYYALRYIPASRISAFSYVQPLLATLMAVPLLGEHITSALALGGVFILGGVYLTERG
jgi:drug/metabolite transporter (DMT)-like permease